MVSTGGSGLLVVLACEGGVTAASHEVVATAPELAETVYRFRLDVTEVVVTRVADDLLQIPSWHAGRGLERRSRA